MKKNTKQWLRKAASVGLAFSLVLASVPAGIIPARVVQAAPGNLETGSILSAQYVKDPTVLNITRSLLMPRKSIQIQRTQR